MKRGRKPSLDPVQVDKIRRLYYETKMSMDALASRFGVSQTVVKNVVMRRGCYAEEANSATPTLDGGRNPIHDSEPHLHGWSHREKG